MREGCEVHEKLYFVKERYVQNKLQCTQYWFPVDDDDKEIVEC